MTYLFNVNKIMLQNRYGVGKVVMVRDASADEGGDTVVVLSVRGGLLDQGESEPGNLRNLSLPFSNNVKIKCLVGLLIYIICFTLIQSNI